MRPSRWHCTASSSARNAFRNLGSGCGKWAMSFPWRIFDHSILTDHILARQAGATADKSLIALSPGVRVRSRPFTSEPGMARDQVDMTPIETRDELVAWFEAGSKPKSRFRIGTEHEKFAFTVEGRRP